MAGKRVLIMLALSVFTLFFMSSVPTVAKRITGTSLTASVLQREAVLSFSLLMKNLQHPGLRPGVVIASPSRQEPNYFYHWIRDAALVMNTVAETNSMHRQGQSLFLAWMNFETLLRAKAQQANGLGEPKFHVDGEPFLGPWGRPQNDGPAIRAWAMLRTTGQFNEGVRADLDYIQKEWRSPDFDLWEEVKGSHFFTRYAQMAAFREAARVALRQEPARARDYGMIATQIEQSLGQFVNPRSKLVTPTLPGSQGVQKPSGLDISVILAVAYFGPTGNWSVANPYLLHTLQQMEEAFLQIYPVNRAYPGMAPGLGRYPEDVYDGNGFQGGNPWYLATFGAAEYYCQLVDELGRQGSIRIEPLNQRFYETAMGSSLSGAPAQVGRDQQIYWDIMTGLQRRGLSFIERALFHAGEDRRYAEQFDRQSGYRRGARDLTWSYAASLRAFQRCQGTLQTLESVSTSFKK